MRGVERLETIEDLEVMKYLFAIGDEEYVEKLKQCLTLLETNNSVAEAETLLNTWRKLKIRGYIKQDKQGPTLFL